MVHNCAGRQVCPITHSDQRIQGQISLGMPLELVLLFCIFDNSKQLSSDSLSDCHIWPSLLCFEQPHISKVKRRHVGSCLKILDMTGLRLSAFSRLKTSTAIATVDDLNYPEKTDTYYIVNAPYVFSACWKVCSQILCEYQLQIDLVLQICHILELVLVEKLG